MYSIYHIQDDQKLSVHLMNTVQKHAKHFKQFKSLTVITYLELGITDGVSVSRVPLALAVGCQAVRLSQIVREEINRCTETF
jgi:hypothetical protein